MRNQTSSSGIPQASLGTNPPNPQAGLLAAGALLGRFAHAGGAYERQPEAKRTVVPIRFGEKPAVPGTIQKVLITDDHSLVRFGIAHLVCKLQPIIAVEHAESRLETLQALCAQPDIGLLIVDLTLADSHGLRIVEDVVALRPSLPVIVISGSEDGELARRAMALGVLGFVPKSADANLTEQAFKLIFAGGRYLPPFAYANARGEMLPRAAITARQEEVLALTCEGLTNKQIASALGLTEATVKGHLTTVFRVLKVSTRSQAILAAQRMNSGRQTIAMVPPDA